MWTTSEIRSRLLAFFVGVGLFLFAATIPYQLIGDDLKLLIALDVTIYALSGIVFGFVWPNDGWRLGLYLFAIWPPMLLFSAFLTAELPWNLWANLKDLLGYLLMLVAGCVGAGLGALVKNRLTTSSNNQERTAP